MSSDGRGTTTVGVPFGDRDMAVLEQYAQQAGLSIEDAASELVSQALADRFMRSTGHRPAKVYQLPTGGQQ